MTAELASIGKISTRFEDHESGELRTSMEGFGPVLATTFLTHVGGHRDNFDTADRLACVAGLARA